MSAFLAVGCCKLRWRGHVGLWIALYELFGCRVRAKMFWKDVGAERAAFGATAPILKQQ